MACCGKQLQCKWKHKARLEFWNRWRFLYLIGKGEFRKGAGGVACMTAVSHPVLKWLQQRNCDLFQVVHTVILPL